MELSSLPIVIVGHVDHGKSTLIGRLLSDTGSLKEQRRQEITDSSSLLGKDVEYAFAMDALEEEREGGLTIDTTQAYFQTEKRRYTLVDAPGHKEFLRNMITGASYAQAAILVIDVNEGVMEQTQRHAFLLNMAGIKHVVVALNKMDLVHYDQGIFEEIKRQIKKYFSNMDLYPTNYIPIAAKTGLNLVHNENFISWYSGPSLLEALDNLEIPSLLQVGVRFPVQDVYQRDGKRILVGRIESGEIRKGMELHVLPAPPLCHSSTPLCHSGEGGNPEALANGKCRVSHIMKFMHDDLAAASYGESIGLIVDNGDQVQRGNVLSGDTKARTTQEFEARIFWFDEIYKKDTITIKHTTQSSRASITIHSKVDPAFIDQVIQNPTDIAIGEVAHVTLTTDQPLIVDSFTEINEMGRFVIESNNVPVACGIILCSYDQRILKRITDGSQIYDREALLFY
jgi:small GTP-binding protein domain